MGMYDSINSEQIKCFPWVSYQHNDTDGMCLWSHGGGLRCFNDNDKVPYRSLSYNYHKDFNIIDMHPTMLPFDNGIVLHAIRNGKVKESITIELLEDTDTPKHIQDAMSNYLSSAQTIGYTGNPVINIHSFDDMIQFYHENIKRRDKLVALRSTSHRLMNEWAKTVRQLHQENLSEIQKNNIKETINQVKTKYDAERKRIEPDIDKVNTMFVEKWCVRNSEETNTFIRFGEWIESGLRLISEHRPKDADEQLEWFMKDFEKLFANTVNRKFVDQYFAWCEATPEEMILVNSFVDKMIANK